MNARRALSISVCLFAACAVLSVDATAQEGGGTAPADATPALGRVRGVGTWRRYVWTLERPLLGAMIDDLESARTASPEDDTTRDFLLAYGYLAGGHRELGVEAAARTERSSPDFVGLPLLEGMLAILDKDPEKAQARFNQYLERLPEAAVEPSFATDLHMLGLLHRGAHAASIGQNELALRDYDAAVATARKSGRTPATQLIQRLARVHQSEGQMHLAEELMLELLAEDPGNANHYFNLGVLHAAQNDHERARVWFLRTLRRRPDFADAHAKLAAIAAKQIRLVEMRRHLDAFTALLREDDRDRHAESDAGYADYYYRISRQFDAEDRPADRDEALRRFRRVCERALEVRPTCVRALELMLRAGGALGLSSEVITEYRERLRGLRDAGEDEEGAFRRTLC